MRRKINFLSKPNYTMLEGMSFLTKQFPGEAGGSARQITYKLINLIQVDSSSKNIITVRKRNCGKIMFSQACVKNSVHRGVYTRVPPAQCMLGYIPLADTSLADTPPQTDPPPPRQPLQRTLRILLECILLFVIFTFSSFTIVPAC